MGGCESCATAHDAEMRSNYAEQLDMQIEREREEEKNHYKILLLGAGESGKSTIIKQLSLLYRKGGIMEDRRQFIRVLQNNTIVSMQALLRAGESMGMLKPSDDGTSYEADIALINNAEGNDAMTEAMVAAIERLWESAMIQEVYMNRSQFWILETADYYFKNCARFIEHNFLPDDVDVIMARKRTTGVIVTEFPTEDGLKFSVVDVGGQRSERRKWINCFDGVKAIFWVSNLSGYDKVLFEDKSINRMQEDLDLFKETLKAAAFRDTPIFLFFNKQDLFFDALKYSTIDTCFPAYKGSSDPTECQEFIAQQFKEALPPSKTIEKILYLSAKDKNNVKAAFEAVKDHLLAAEKAKPAAPAAAAGGAGGADRPAARGKK